MLGGWVGDSLKIVQQRRERGGKPMLRAQTPGHPAAIIVMVTCRLVGALTTGREDE